MQITSVLNAKDLLFAHKNKNGRERVLTMLIIRITNCIYVLLDKNTFLYQRDHSILTKSSNLYSKAHKGLFHGSTQVENLA